MNVRKTKYFHGYQISNDATVAAPSPPSPPRRRRGGPCVSPNDVLNVRPNDVLYVRPDDNMDILQNDNMYDDEKISCRMTIRMMM